MGASPDIAGVILCGGRSSRMGGHDKCLSPLGTGTMLDEVIARAAPQVEPLAISANGDPDRFSRFALRVLPDPIPDYAGPLSGILAGLDWADETAGSGRLVSFAGDTPFFPRDLVSRLSAARGTADCVSVARSMDRNHPVFALWPCSLRNRLRDFLAAGQSRSVAAFLAMHPVQEVIFAPVQTRDGPIDPFFNVNRPQDLEVAARLAEELCP